MLRIASFSVMTAAIAGCAQGPVQQAPGPATNTNVTRATTTTANSDAGTQQSATATVRFALYDYAHIGNSEMILTETADPTSLTTDASDPAFWRTFLGPATAGASGAAQIISNLAGANNTAQHHPDKYICALWKSVERSGELNLEPGTAGTGWRMTTHAACDESLSDDESDAGGIPEMLPPVTFDPMAPASSLLNAYMLAQAAKEVYRTQDQYFSLAQGWGFTHLRSVFIEASETKCIAQAKIDVGIVINCMGTSNDIQWANNFDYRLSDNELGLSTSAKAHHGLMQTSKTLAPLIDAAIAEFVSKNVATSTSPIWVTGHSRGAALATLQAIRLAKLGKPVRLVVFGGPRTLNAAGAREATSVIGNANIANFFTDGDLVPHVPLTKKTAEDPIVGPILNQMLTLLLGSGSGSGG